MRCYYWELAVDLPVLVRPTAAPPARSTVDGVRLGLRPASRQTQGDRPNGSAAQRAGLPSLGLQRLGLHRAADPGGKAFAIVTVLPTLMITAWLLPGLPLLLAGRFFPVPMVLISVPLAVGLVLMTSRQLPGRWPGPGTKERFGTRGGTANWSALWGLAGTLLVAAGFGIWQLRANSPQLIVDRDPGAFFQFAYWIAEHGSLPIPAQLAAFGGSHAGLTFGSFGFAGQGEAVVPGLPAGLPITLAAGLWTHGLAGGVALSPLLGALAVLSVGGLTGRLAGPQWAPAGALLLALTLPETYTSRSAFSQIVAQALLFGGLCLVVDSLAPRQSRILAALGGLALGLTVLVEIGSLVNLLPVIVFLGTLLAVRRPQALPFAGGLLAGTGYGLVGGFVLAGPMMAALAPELGLVALAAAAFLAVTLVGAAAGLVDPVRRNVARLLRARPLRWLPEAGAVIVVAVAAGLLIRPYLQRVEGAANPYVAALQRISQLPVDPRRLYAEDSLYWVVWYLGVPALLLGVAGLALLTRRCLRALITWQDPTGMARAWALPLMIIGWGAVAVLWLPHTMPDQPWASRAARSGPAPRPDRGRDLGLCPAGGAGQATGRGGGGDCGRRRLLRGRAGGAVRGDHVRDRGEADQPARALPGQRRPGVPADGRRSARCHHQPVRGHTRRFAGADPGPGRGPAVHPGDPRHVRHPGRGHGRSYRRPRWKRS